MKQFVKIAGLGLLLLSIGMIVAGCATGVDGGETVLRGTKIIDEDHPIEGNLTVFGGDVTLSQKAKVDGNLNVLGGSIKIEEKAKVDGDLNVLGGNIKIETEAKVDGNLTVMGGHVTLQDGSEIDGDLISWGGEITGSENAIIDGDRLVLGGAEQNASIGDLADSLGIDLDHENLNREELEAEIEAEIEAAAMLSVAQASTTGMMFGFFGQALLILLKTTIFGVLGLVLTLFLPQHVRRIGYTAEKSPVASAAVGCLSIPALLVLAVIAMVTIIGIPLGLLIPFLAMAGGVLGWIGVGFFFGNRLLKMADIRAPRPAAAAAIGAGSLALVGYMAQIVPIFGDLVMPFIGMWGFGATILTRGGRQSYPIRSGFDRSMPVDPFFDPLDELDELDFTTPSKKTGGGDIDNLFADLAADLGLDDMFDDDEDEDGDDKPNRPETPMNPSK